MSPDPVYSFPACCAQLKAPLAIFHGHIYLIPPVLQQQYEVHDIFLLRVFYIVLSKSSLIVLLRIYMPSISKHGGLHRYCWPFTLEPIRVALAVYLW